MKRLVIMRGLPGSGKSTVARARSEAAKQKGIKSVVHSTDDYFLDCDGVYRFQGVWIKEAHEWNSANVKRSIRANYELIVVDNTHTQFWELKTYVILALEHGYEVEIAEPWTEWKFDVDTLVQKNTHDVPVEAITRMLKRWESTEDIIEGCVEKFHCENKNGILSK